VAGTLELDAHELSSDLVEIFVRRDTHPLPGSLPAPPGNWQRSWDRFAEDLLIPKDLGAGHKLAASLVDPVLDRRASGYWSPDALCWGDCA
jgi:hypothetical protein